MPPVSAHSRIKEEEGGKERREDRTLPYRVIIPFFSCSAIIMEPWEGDIWVCTFIKEKTTRYPCPACWSLAWKVISKLVILRHRGPLSPSPSPLLLLLLLLLRTAAALHLSLSPLPLPPRVPGTGFLGGIRLLHVRQSRQMS